MKNNKFHGFMLFEAVKLVSPSSSSSSLRSETFATSAPPTLARRKTIKTFLIFHNPMPPPTTWQSTEKKNSGLIVVGTRKPRYRSGLVHSVLHISTWREHSFENDNFKERNRRTQQILVIFHSFNGRRECCVL